MNVGLIGVGRCGLPIALCFEQKGHNVIASSYKEKYVADLQTKKINTTEPHVHELLQNSKITFTTDNQYVIDQSDVIYIIVATPSLPTGDYDMQAIDNVVDDIKKYKGNLKDKLCIIASTTNPGYCQTVSDTLKAYECDVVYCPIYVAQGGVYEDFANQDHVMVGTDSKQAFTKAKNFFETLVQSGDQIIALSYTGTEIVKMALNCFSTLKISFANMMGQLLYKSGSWKDKDAFYNLMKLNPNVGTRLIDFGFGYGGPCLPRDNRSLVKFAEKIGYNYELGNLVDQFNDKHVDFLYDYYCTDNKNNLPYFFSYISYKAGTDLDEPAQQYDLAEMFLKNNIQVYVAPSKFLNDKVYNRLKTLYPDLLEKQSAQELDSANVKYYKIN